ncbi:MAG: AAA family ATPase [Gallionella sp.]|nr:AAA family ATPase [Gallionella sp.]
MTLIDLVNNARFSVLLGKNGSGKSTLLRSLKGVNTFNTKYISPERGGTLKYDPNVDLNISNDENWIINDRQKNRTEQFRQQSAAQFRNLEVLVLREIEQNLEKRNDASYSFNNTLSKINALLPAIELRRADRAGFSIHNKTGNTIPEDQISSGEAELIALTIEVLVFSQESKENKVLLLDEPDVHLHPDLQQKFIAFIEEVATEYNFKVVLATHSTAIIGSFSREADLQIVPITVKDQTDFSNFRFNPICHEILPVFGAHPLSTQFNRSPVLLVEGEDDKRVIEQLIRSANGRFKLSPCVVGTVSEMSTWEIWLNDFLPAIYDEPKGFSLRDLDESQQCDIDDVGCVSRARLNCYAIENIMLTNECLKLHGYSADEFRNLLSEWASQHEKHQASASLAKLSKNFDNRRTIKIKDIRNVVVALLGTQKPWEVLVGQLLASHIDSKDTTKHSLYEYLGSSVVRKLFS